VPSSIVFCFFRSVPAKSGLHGGRGREEPGIKDIHQLVASRSEEVEARFERFQIEGHLVSCLALVAANRDSPFASPHAREQTARIAAVTRPRRDGFPPKAPRGRILDAMGLDLSVPLEIRPLRDGDLDGLEWDSEQAIQAVIRLLSRPIADLEPRPDRDWRRASCRDHRGVSRG